MLALHSQIIILTVVQNGHSGGWRDSSASRQVYCSCRVPEYSSQSPVLGSSESLIVPMLENLLTSLDVGTYTHMCLCERTHIYIHTCTYTHTYAYKGRLVLRERKDVIITFWIYLFVYLFLVQGVRPSASICLFEWRNNAREGKVLGSYPQPMKLPRPSCHGA